MLLQDSDCEMFYLLNPEQESLRAGVEHLRTTYPQVPVDSLHNVLAIVNGDTKAAAQVCRLKQFFCCSMCCQQRPSIVKSGVISAHMQTIMLRDHTACRYAMTCWQEAH